jgi:hypothetical protein
MTMGVFLEKPEEENPHPAPAYLPPPRRHVTHHIDQDSSKTTWTKSSVKALDKLHEIYDPHPQQNDSRRRPLHATLGFLIGSRWRIFTPV